MSNFSSKFSKWAVIQCKLQNAKKGSLGEDKLFSFPRLRSLIEIKLWSTYISSTGGTLQRRSELWSPSGATDNFGIIPTTTCSSDSGTNSGTGATEVLCVAIDNYGKNETCNFQIEIESEYYVYVDDKYLNKCKLLNGIPRKHIVSIS